MVSGLPTTSSLLSNPLLQQNQRFITMPSDDPSLGIDEVFLGSCKEVSGTLSLGYSILPTATLISLSPISYKLAKLSLDSEDKEAVVSDMERLSAFYPNAAYDFYAPPSGALCVCTLLDDKKARWTSMDPLAFAEAGEMTFSPLLIWIGVEPASLAYELANTAAAAVTFFLTQAGFSGFEIGFRESVVTRSVTGPKMLSFNPFHDTIPMFRKPFTPTLGLSIAPFKTPYFEGTGALYFRESKDSKCVLFLTCAYVARPPPAHCNTSHPCKQVIALGNSGYTSALKCMMGAIGGLDRSTRDWQDVLCWLGKP